MYMYILFLLVSHIGYERCQEECAPEYNPGLTKPHQSIWILRERERERERESNTTRMSIRVIKTTNRVNPSTHQGHSIRSSRVRFEQNLML